MPKHTHKFRRHTYETGGVIYFCVLPDCSVKIKPALTLGKRAICWRCEEEFIMTEYTIKLAKPHCGNCHKPKNREIKHYTISDDLTIMYPELTTGGKISNDTISDLRSRLSGEKDEEGEI